MNNQYYFVILIGLLICTGFWWIIPNRNDTTIYGGDFLFHFGKASKTTKGLIASEGVELSSVRSFPTYPSLFHLLASPFSLRLELFLICIFTLFFIVFPLVLIKVSGHWSTGLFFLASSAPFTFANGTIVQGFVTLLLVPFVFAKKLLPKKWVIPFRVVMLFIAIMTHSHGWLLFGGYWAIELIVKIDWRKLFLAGVCYFPTSPKMTREQTINQMVEHTGTNLFGTKGLLTTGWIGVSRWFCFNPLSVIGFLGLWYKHKTLFFFVLAIFVFSFVFLWWRVVESAAPFIAIGVAEYYVSSKKRMRKCLVITALVLIVMLFLHQLSLYQYLGFSFTGAIECALHGFGAW